MRYKYTGTLDWRPERIDKTSAGMDLVNDGETVTIAPTGLEILNTGIHVEIPVGYWGLLAARSSLGFKMNTMLINSIGVIDAAYRGEIKVKLINQGSEPVTIERGERFCQLILVPCLVDEWVEANELSSTERGLGGFGSTGRK